MNLDKLKLIKENGSIKNSVKITSQSAILMFFFFFYFVVSFFSSCWEIILYFEFLILVSVFFYCTPFQRFNRLSVRRNI